MFSSKPKEEKEEKRNETMGSRIVDADKPLDNNWPTPAPDIKEVDKVAEHVKLVGEFSREYLKNYQEEAKLTGEVDELKKKLTTTQGLLQAAAEARRLSAEDIKRVMNWNFSGTVQSSKTISRY